MKALLVSLSRFGTVGAVATGAYVGGASLLSAAGLSPPVASALAFAPSNAVSYVGHRGFTFRSDRAHRAAVPRFLAMSAVCLALSFLIPWTIDRLTGVAPLVNFVATAALIAAASYVGLRFGVFAGGPRGNGTGERDV